MLCFIPDVFLVLIALNLRNSQEIISFADGNSRPHDKGLNRQFQGRNTVSTTTETAIMLNEHLQCLSAAKKLSNRARQDKEKNMRYPHHIEIFDALSDIPVLTFIIDSDKATWSWDADIEAGKRQITGRSMEAKLRGDDRFKETVELRRTA